MSILKKMLVRLPVKKSYLTMAWDATAKGQTDLALHLFKLAYEQETLPEKKAEAAWNVYVDCKNKEKYHEAYLWCERTARLGFVKADPGQGIFLWTWNSSELQSRRALVPCRS